MNKEPASFRDPAGFLFWRDGVLYRQVNREYLPHYRRLMSSGLYRDLTGRGWLIPHEEVDVAPARADDAAQILRPRRLPFISYPYEWCFAQLKDAALLTLAIAARALESDMILKDASSFNVAFDGPTPVFIDTLSFEEYREGEPWVAYRQFCEHFLAPLALMASTHVEMGRLLSGGIDGIPLAAASRALPRRSWLSSGLLMHLHLHARGERSLAKSGPGTSRRGVGRRAFAGLLDSLEGTVRGLKWRPEGIWSDYYDGDSYSEEAFSHKEETIRSFLGKLAPGDVWDLGGNVGTFSRIAEEEGARVVSFDADPACVQINYRKNRELGSEVLPLWVDLTNPTPPLGWCNRERESLLNRGPADVAMGLALVHHLAIGNNVPLPEVAQLFARTGRDAVVEFVPKDDDKVRGMLAGRRDIFGDYTRESFERSFKRYFDIEETVPLRDSHRILYLMRGGWAS